MPQNSLTGLTNLKNIILDDNKLSALHPRTFSHLAKLDLLSLRRNTCIDNSFSNNPSKTMIEEELAECGTGYTVQRQ